MVVFIVVAEQLLSPFDTTSVSALLPDSTFCSFLVAVMSINCLLFRSTDGKLGVGVFGVGDRGKSATPVLVLVLPQGPNKNRAVRSAPDC